MIVDHACSAYSYISALLYDTLGPEAVKYIMNHADTQAIFCVPSTLNTKRSYESGLKDDKLPILIKTSEGLKIDPEYEIAVRTKSIRVMVLILFVLCTVTLGAPGEAQSIESLVGPPSKRFMLHYSFPPFCINEVGKRVGLNRREVGHGNYAAWL
ncbi:hypothetical protein OROMI_033832 [Orobanche minor]